MRKKKFTRNVGVLLPEEIYEKIGRSDKSKRNPNVRIYNGR